MTLKYDNESLVAAIQRGENETENLEKLYFNNIGLIEQLSNKYTGRAEKEDLQQESFFGLREAARRYSPDLGSFSSYLCIWLKQSMLKCIYRNAGAYIPRNQQAKIAGFRKARADYEKEHGHAPALAEIAEYLEITPAEAEKLSIQAEFLALESIDREITASGGETVPLSDFLAAPETPLEDLEDQLCNEELAGVLWPIVDGLKPKQAEVIHRFYQNNETLPQIAENMNLSPGRAHALRVDGLNALKKPCNADRLKPYYDEETTAAAYRATGLQYFVHTHTSAPERIAIERADQSRRRKRPPEGKKNLWGSNDNLT